MTQATSRGMFSGCGDGLKSSTSGLESIIPVSTSTSPAGWSIVHMNTGQRSPSTRSSRGGRGSRSNRNARTSRDEDELSVGSVRGAPHVDDDVAMRDEVRLDFLALTEAEGR